VHLTGNKAGVWGAWAAGKGGDALDLIAAVKCGGNKSEAIRWALNWLRIDPQNVPSSMACAAPNRSARTPPKKDAAFRLWLAASPLRPGDEAYDYLAHARGIDFGVLGRVPSALRFFSRLTEPETGQRFPALLAGVFDRRGRLLTVHRT